MASLVSPPRPPSRPSSRTSIRSGRAPSPVISMDDPVALRNQMSSLRHSIRQQQAQLQRLENEVLRGPRPIPPGLMYSPPHSPVESDFTASPPPSQQSQSNWLRNRRSSHEQLAELAGSDSGLPLPRRDGVVAGIPEGIPANTNRRTSSPTRSLSRIPVSSVGSARALADEGQARLSRSTGPSASTSPLMRAVDTPSPAPTMSSLALPPSPKPNRRNSITTGNTTKVLADLQAGVTSTRNALENTKQQLRQSQRQVAQLTRLTEDLKDSRERLRLEIEGVNAVVARKERMLQEAVERARKAEGEATTLKAQLKQETTTTRKSMREMEAALNESTALSSKSEREYITLRDSIKGLTEGWKADVEGLREEMRRREERWRTEAEEVGQKYQTLVAEVQASQGQKETVRDLLAEDEKLRKQIEEEVREEMKKMREEVERSSKDSEKAAETAKYLSAELSWLRRLMQSTDASDEAGSQS